jgi:hypothetical protein
VWRIFGGAALVVAGIAAFVEAQSHRPMVRPAARSFRQAEEEVAAPRMIHVGLSTTAYDILRVGAWALVIVGALLSIVGLIRVVQRG